MNPAPGGIKGVLMQIRNLFAATLLFSMTMAAAPALAATHDTAKKPTTTTFKVSGTTFTEHQKGTFTVTVTPKTASGTGIVYYKELPGGTTKTFGKVTISAGHGSGSREAWDVGKFSLWVEYEGSSKFKASKSNVITVTVKP
jgi:hypothetical protein